MPDRKKEVDLRSVHYEIEDLRELESILTDGEKVTRYSLSIKEKDGSQEFDSVDDVVESRNLPDEVRDFSLSVCTNSGRVRVNADDRHNFHKATISGDGDWVLQKKAELKEFTNLREDWLGNKRSIFTILQATAFGGLLGVYQEQLTAVFVSFYHYDAPLKTDLIAVGIILLIGFLQLTKTAYPFVALEIESGGLRYKKWLGYASSLSTGILTVGVILEFSQLI